MPSNAPRRAPQPVGRTEVNFGVIESKVASSNVETALSDLHQEITFLRNVVDELATRLETAMLPESAAATAATSAPRPVTSPLASNIESAAVDLMRLRMRVIDLRDRVDL